MFPKNHRVVSLEHLEAMNAADAQREFAEADWRVVGLKLLIFTRYWARNHYGWSEMAPLPEGKAPEDITVEVYQAFRNGNRKLRSDVPLLRQLKSAAKSILWNLHKLKDAELSKTHDPEFFEPFEDGRGDFREELASSEVCQLFLSRLKNEPQVRRNGDLAALVDAIEEGAMTASECCESTGFPETKVYELRRRLKPVAERIWQNVKRDERHHETNAPRSRLEIA